jgi:hypothetical protein
MHKGYPYNCNLNTVIIGLYSEAEIDDIFLLNLGNRAKEIKIFKLRFNFQLIIKAFYLLD